MSRGLGQVERAVLTALDGQDRCTSTDLERRIYGDAATTAQRVSLRRAVRSLHRKELVDVARVAVPVGTVSRWSGWTNNVSMNVITARRAPRPDAVERPESSGGTPG